MSIKRSFGLALVTGVMIFCFCYAVIYFIAGTEIIGRLPGHINYYLSQDQFDARIVSLFHQGSIVASVISVFAFIGMYFILRKYFKGGD